MKLRIAQATITTMRKKRARLPALSSPSGLPELLREERKRILSAVWRALTQGQAGVAFGSRPTMCGHMAEKEQKTLEHLFQAEPDRLSRFSFDLAGIHFDWSKTHLDAAVIKQSLKRAEQMGFAPARDALFAGGIVNPSEGRDGNPCRRARQRGARGSRPRDRAPPAHARSRRCDRGRSIRRADGNPAYRDRRFGAWAALLVDALGRRASILTVRFLSNIDGAAFDEAVSALDPATTLVVVASKTFTTLETLTNMEAARRGFEQPASPIRTGGSSRSRRAPKPRSIRGSTKAGSSSSAKGSADAIRCGARSA